MPTELMLADELRGVWRALGETRILARRIVREAADEITALKAENARLREALSDICKDSNPDWTEKRVYPLDVLDDIHTIAVDAYYSRPARQPQAGGHDER
jgi:hypothetical protein